MLWFLLSGCLPLHLSINENEYDGDSLDDILVKNQISKDSVYSIHIISGTYEFGSFSAVDFPNLSSFQLDYGCFKGLIDYQYFSNSKSLKKLIISSEISISKYFVNGCNNLAEVNLTNLDFIPEETFSSLANLENITIY